MPARAVRTRRRPIDPEKYARLIAAALPIPPRTEADNERLIELLAELDERSDLSPEEQSFAELLAIVVEDFEDKHYALAAVPPGQALKALMADRGLRHRDVWPVVGNKGLTTEILSGRRKISSALAKRLAEHFRVPVELFV
jgi:HTH-type transcriptional regulator/antitoxin HigA